MNTRERIAEALGEHMGWQYEVTLREAADALVPLVEELARERAATELRNFDIPGLAKSYAVDRAAAELETAAREWPDAYASSVSDWLEDRAAALRAGTQREAWRP